MGMAQIIISPIFLCNKMLEVLMSVLTAVKPYRASLPHNNNMQTSQNIFCGDHYQIPCSNGGKDKTLQDLLEAPSACLDMVREFLLFLKAQMCKLPESWEIRLDPHMLLLLCVCVGVEGHVLCQKSEFTV